MANPIASIILTAVDKTKAAFNSVKGALGGLRQSASDLRNQFSLIFAGLSVAGFIGQLKTAIDAMDRADESAQRIGTSVENFTALGYAAEQSGVPLDDLEGALAKLARTLDSAKTGTGAAADTFRRLQIDPKQFSDPADALAVLADRFAAMPDGITKTALAQELFGKSGAKLVPLLNQGAAGLAALRAEAEALGIVMSGETAAAAAELNDNLDKLRAASRGFNSQIAKDIVPGLTEISKAMTEAAKDGGLLQAAWVGLGGIGAALFTDEFKSTAKKLEEAREQLARATTGLFTDENAAASLRERIAALEAEAEAELKSAQAKKQAADAAEKAAAESEAAFEKRDEELRGFKDSVDEQIKDANRLEDALKSAFSGSIRAEEDYLRQAKKLRAEASRGTVGDDAESQASAALDATIAAMKLQREAGTANLETVQEQAQALRDMADQLNDVQQAEDLRRQANLAEATALEKAAADERSRYQGIAEQQRIAAAEAERLQAALEGIGKEVSVEIKPGAGVAQVKQDLTEIKHLIDYIKANPVSVAATGGAGTADALRTAALQYGRRG